NFAKTIKETRKERSLNLSQAAEQMGINVGTLSRIENKKTTPRGSTKQKINQWLKSRKSPNKGFFAFYIFFCKKSSLPWYNLVLSFRFLYFCTMSSLPWHKIESFCKKSSLPWFYVFVTLAQCLRYPGTKHPLFPFFMWCLH